MVSLKRAAAVLSIALAISLSAAQANDEHPEAVAQAAALAWLTLVDAGNYAASWDAAATRFRESLAREDWVARAASLRGSMGALNSRNLKSETYTHSLPGVPNGDYVVIRFSSSFAQTGAAVETVTPMKDADGAWRVTGYFIK
jgi:hypothetical protein